MYADVPEPAEYPELTDQDIASLAEDRISALPDAMLTALLDDLHERTAGMTREQAAALEPAIAALELEAVRRGITRPAIPEPATRPPVMLRLRKAAAAGDTAAFRRALRVVDGAGFFQAYMLALEWPDAVGRASAINGVFWALTERIYGLGVALDRGNELVESGLSPEQQLGRLREHIENTLAELVLAGEQQRLGRR